MGADKDFAMNQLRRFESYPGVPQTTAELEERAQWLVKLGESNERCRLIADRMMRTVRYFPLVVDMEIAAEEHGAAPPWDDPADPPKCGCGGTGWLSWDDDRGISHARRCACMATGVRR